MTQNRDREVNFQKNSREFSRIETLAGHWCEETFFGPSRHSAMALVDQNILTVRTHLKTHSGEKPNATNMDSSRRLEETFESTLWGKVKQMQPM